ncbi:MAG: Protein-arginine-phosphatase [Stenotrophomonas maltophilia]|nr:MAG: Protein-arginine-phosphatase [Stenotrophomonas maltophilia]
MRRALFICSRNRLRSPSAQVHFANWPGVETDSAGLAADAEVLLEPEQLAWADLVFVMEPRHRRLLAQRYPQALRHKRVICLDISDDYDYLQPELLELLERRAGGYLRDE